MSKHPEIKKVLTCRSCGATLEEGLMRCPYCDGVDLFMAEVTFMDKMHDMSDELSEMAGEDAPKDRDISHSHEKNMDAFGNVYAGAKNDLEKKVKAHGSLALNYAVIAVLIVIIAAFAFIFFNRFTLHEKYISWKNTRAFDEHVSEIERLLDEGDFCTLMSYCENHEIDGRFDGFDAYRTVIAQSNSYFRFTDIMLSHVFYEGRDDNIMKSNTESLVYYLHDFYENGDPESDHMSYKNDLIDREKGKLANDKMEKEIHGMLKYYCNFSDEELASLSGLTKTKMQNLFYEKHALTGD